MPDRDHTILMGATTYRLMAGFADGSGATGQAEDDAIGELTAASKVVFSSTLELPLGWDNTRLVSTDPVAEVRTMKEAGTSMRTVGSLTLCRLQVLEYVPTVLSGPPGEHGHD